MSQIDVPKKGEVTNNPLLSEYLRLFCKVYTVDPENIQHIDIDSKLLKSGGDCRIYYYSEKTVYGIKLDNPGFYFMVVVICTYCPDDGEWGRKTEVNKICQGEAKFDGIRHIWFGDDEHEGYLYYPNTYLIKLIMEELMKLENKFCDQKSCIGEK